MNRSTAFPFAGLLVFMGASVGCAQVDDIAFRQPSNEFAALIAESENLTHNAVQQTDQARPAESSEPQKTLVTTASPHVSRQPSLITLSPRDDLMAKINRAGGPVLLDFYADWCGPCRIQGKILHEMESTAERHHALMIKINVDDHPAIARQLQVQGIPTLIMVKNGQIANRQSGVADRATLESWMK